VGGGGNVSTVRTPLYTVLVSLSEGRRCMLAMFRPNRSFEERGWDKGLWVVLWCLFTEFPPQQRKERAELVESYGRKIIRGLTRSR
jgi:hypothetical protein